MNAKKQQGPNARDESFDLAGDARALMDQFVRRKPRYPEKTSSVIFEYPCCEERSRSTYRHGASFQEQVNGKKDVSGCAVPPLHGSFMARRARGSVKKTRANQSDSFLVWILRNKIWAKNSKENKLTGRPAIAAFTTACISSTPPLCSLQ